MSGVGNCGPDRIDAGRRAFVVSAAGTALMSAGGACAAAATGMTVAVITQSGGAHLTAYFRALADSPAVAAVVVVDRDGASFEEARGILGAKLRVAGKDPAAILAAERPGMALVSMEARLAPEMIRLALESGCHVLAEKPACLTVDEIALPVRAAGDRGLLFMLALANRLNPEVVEAKRRIDAGEVGRVVGVEMHLVQDRTRLTRPAYQTSWFADRTRSAGGHLAWLGIHWLDLAMHLTGNAIEEVAGFTANVGGEPVAIEDSAVLAFRFAGGSLGTLTSAYWLDTGHQSHLRIWGTRGWLAIDDSGGMQFRVHADGGSPAGEPVRTAAAHDAYGAFVHAAVVAAAGGGPAPIDGVASLRVLETVFAAYAAAESGRSVRLGTR